MRQDITAKDEQIKECDKEKSKSLVVLAERKAAIEKVSSEVETSRRLELDLTRKLAAAQQLQADLRAELIEKDFKKKRAREEEVHNILLLMRIWRVVQFSFSDFIPGGRCSGWRRIGLNFATAI